HCRPALDHRAHRARPRAPRWPHRGDRAQLAVGAGLRAARTGRLGALLLVAAVGAEGEPDAARLRTLGLLPAPGQRLVDRLTQRRVDRRERAPVRRAAYASRVEAERAASRLHGGYDLAVVATSIGMAVGEGSAGGLLAGGPVPHHGAGAARGVGERPPGRGN